MIFITNLCLFGCVIVSSLVLLNNSVMVFANAKPNVNRVNGATVGPVAGAPSPQWQRDDTDDDDNDDRTKILAMMDADETTTAATPKQRFHDDRLVFERPSVNRVTTTTTARPSAHDVPIKSNATMQSAFEIDGEYSFGVRLKEGTRHAESGEYETRNGKRVFIIRGYFGHITPKGDFHITAYVFDHTGYHEIPVDTGVTDFRPDIGGGECDLSTGNYCIDQKLLTLMVG